MARYKLSKRIPEEVLYLADQHYPLYPIEELFPPRFANDEQFAAELERRLKRIPYPYEPTRAQKALSQSTLEVLDKLGAVTLILEPSVVSQLRIWAGGPEYWSGMRQINSSSTAAGKKFRAFHVSLTKELSRHSAVVRKLAGEYQLGEKWIGPYLRTTEERLIVEAALLKVYMEAKPDSEAKATRKSVRMVYPLVSGALEIGKVSNHALCRHLTSIVCSSNCLTTGVLLPSPESVRKLLARNPDKKKNKSRN